MSGSAWLIIPIAIGAFFVLFMVFAMGYLHGAMTADRANALRPRPTAPLAELTEMRRIASNATLRADVAEEKVARLRALLSSIHEDALYENECKWCGNDPADDHETIDIDGEEHPCFGQRIHDAIKDAWPPRTTSVTPDE